MRQSEKNKQGSMTLGSLIIVLLVTAVGIAIINRTLEGIKIAADMRKGYTSYQGSDQVAEEFMNKLRTLDGEDGVIPECVCAYHNDYCGENGTLCDLGSGYSQPTCNPHSVDKEDSLAVVKGVQKKYKENGVERFLQASLQNRVFNGLSPADFSVEQCGTPGVCSGNVNRCDLKLTLDVPSDTADILEYEVRRSTTSDLGQKNDYGWSKLPSNPPNNGIFPATPSGTKSQILVNGDSKIPLGMTGSQSLGQYGVSYSFTVKAKNKNPFYLDSLYLYHSENPSKAPQTVTMETWPDCTNDPDTQLYGLGCIIKNTNPAGTRLSNNSYNCCNNTECYEPDPGWKPDPGHDCALQQCQPGDNVGENPIGTATTGYCGDSAPCLSGTSCTYPYKAVGYCKEKPSASTQSVAFFASTEWELSNYQQIYQGNPPAYPVPGFLEGDPPGKLPRCSKHLCPTTVQNGCGNGGSVPGGHGSYAVNFSCSDNVCGGYDANVRCSLTCSAGYYEYKNESSNSNGVSVSYPNKYCCASHCTEAELICPPGWVGRKTCVPVCGGHNTTMVGCIPIP